MNKKSITKALYLFGIFAVTLATAFPAAAASIASTTVITNAVASGDIGTTSVNVSGVFNAPNSTLVSTRFDWGLSPSLGNSTPVVQYSTASGQMSATISGLSSGQQYFVRAYALGNSSGAGYGSTLSFTTKSISAPIAITQSASNVTASSATMNGAFNGNNSASTDLQFVYGTSSTNLNQSTGFITQSAVSGNFAATITGLSASTTYYYRAVAKNSAGTTNAPTILSFTTLQTQGSACAITNFYASPAPVNYGSSTTLYYTTTNCNSVSIDNGIGSLSNTSGSYTTGTIYGTTTYTLTASGSFGSTQTSTVAVTLTNGNGNNQCTINNFYATPAFVNPGSSTTIYWSTTNCYNVYLSTYGSASTSGSFTTGAIYGTMTYTINASGNNGSPSQTLTVYANQNNGCTYNCNPCTFNCYPNPTPDPVYYPPTPQIIYVDGGTNYYDTSYNVASVGDALSLSIDSGFPYIYPSDIFTYAIKYKNISSRNVNNAELSVDLPREVQLVGHSTGVTESDGRRVTVSLGTLSPGESGVLNLEVRADNFLSKNDRVLAKASLTGVFSNGDRTSVSDYSIVSIKNGKNPLLSASAIFGENGFLPYTFGGWLLLIALVALIIFVGKTLYERRRNVNAYGAHTIYSAHPTNSEADRDGHHH